MPFKNFQKYSIISILAWNTFWGTLVFTLGDKALQLITSPKFVIPIGLIWILAILITNYIEKRADKKI